MDPKLAAYRSWGCSRLLDDTAFRNNYKYLVAYYKKEIVGTFCIHGVSIDNLAAGSRRKVKFLLEETDEKCDERVKSIVYNLINLDLVRILKAQQSFTYIDVNHINQGGVDIEKVDCSCKVEEIRILKPDEINDEIYADQKHLAYGLPDNVWLRIRATRNFFDSFRLPSKQEIKTLIEYYPDGKITFEKTDNFRSPSLVKNKLDATELQTVRYILATFHHDPKNAIVNIDKSDFERGNHLNYFHIEFEAFSDKNMTNRIQHVTWSKDVIAVKNGFLKNVSQIMF